MCYDVESVTDVNLPASKMYGKAEMKGTNWLPFGEGLACGESEGCAKVAGLRSAGKVSFK